MSESFGCCRYSSSHDCDSASGWVRPSFVVWREEPDLDLKRLSMGRIASDMAATDACTADWITVSSNVLSICVAMVDVSVITAVDKAVAGSVVVVVTLSVGKRTVDSQSLDPFRSGASGDKVILL